MSERDDRLSCHEAVRLMAFYIKDDPTLSPDEREGFERHLLVCPSCAAEYEQEKRLEVLLEAYWAFKQSSEGLSASARQDADGTDSLCASSSACEPLPVPAGSERALRSGPRLVEACRRGERKGTLARVAWQVGVLATAACILIAIGIRWAMVHKGGAGQQAPLVADAAGSPAAFAELATPEGRKPLALNQLVMSGAQPQEILLGGMHRVVMNRDTKAVFLVQPQRTDGPYAGKVPYAIELAQGELYAEVVPGSPFTVRTPNARLEITGTTFDVVADGDTTDLTLLKGSIWFGALDHPQHAVSVTAGQASTITGRLAPTAPARIDAIAATAWARDVALGNAMALADAHAGVDLSSLSMTSEEFWRQADVPDVDTLDYETWRDAHEQPRSTLASLIATRLQAINADWIELLMVSGDVWQFRFDPRLPADQPLAKIEPAGISRLARYYGLDERSILKALGQPESVLTTTLSVEGGTPGRRYALALRRWHDAVVAAMPDGPEGKDDPRLFSLYASQYLAETQTAAYLWVKNNPEKARKLLADNEYLAMLPTPPPMGSDGVLNVDEWLKQLHDQANAARGCVPASMEWLLVPPGTGCSYQATEQQRRLAELMGKCVPATEGNP